MVPLDAADQLERSFWAARTAMPTSTTSTMSFFMAATLAKRDLSTPRTRSYQQPLQARDGVGRELYLHLVGQTRL